MKMNLDNTGDDLRVSLGRVLNRATSAMTHNPSTVLGVWLASAAFSGLWQWFVGNAAANPAAGISSGLTTVFFLGIIVAVAISSVSQAVMTFAVLAEAQERRIGLGEAVMASLPMILPVFGFMCLWSFGVGLGMVLFVVPGLILLSMWAVGVPVLLAEDEGIMAAFGRSRELTKGHRWKVFGLLLLIMGVYYLLLAMLGVFSLTTSTLGPVSLVVVSLVGSVLYLFWGLASPSLYVELVQAKEGLADGGLEEVFA